MMQIVIDIPEHYYENNIKKELPIFLTEEQVVAILSKGHGALKDVDKIISNGISKEFCDWYDEMKYADTIIPADEESEEQA